MAGKKQFVYFVNTRSKDGKNQKYPVYKSGDDYYIGDNKVPKGKDLEDEVRDLYGAEVTGIEMPHPLHEETKFKNNP